MAHVRQELALRMIGMDCVLPCPVQLFHLLMNHTQIDRKNNQHYEYQRSASSQYKPDTLLTQAAYDLVQRVIGHDTYQIPAGTGKGRTIQMPVALPHDYQFRKWFISPD